MKQEIFDKYVESVCSILKLTKEELFSKSRARTITDARQMLYFLCYSKSVRIIYIQKYMKDNGFDIHHTAIVRSISSLKEKMKQDSDYIKVIKKLELN